MSPGNRIVHGWEQPLLYYIYNVYIIYIKVGLHGLTAIWARRQHGTLYSTEDAASDPRKCDPGQRKRCLEEGNHLYLLAQTRGRKTWEGYLDYRGSQWSSFFSWLDCNTQKYNHFWLLLPMSGDSLHWEGGTEFHYLLMKAWNVRKEYVLRGFFLCWGFCSLPGMPKFSSHLAPRQRW